MDGLERVAVQPVQPLPSCVKHVNRSHFSKHPQVLGHLWLGRADETIHDMIEDSYDLVVSKLPRAHRRALGWSGDA